MHFIFNIPGQSFGQWSIKLQFFNIYNAACLLLSVSYESRQNSAQANIKKQICQFYQFFDKQATLNKNYFDQILPIIKIKGVTEQKIGEGNCLYRWHFPSQGV